MPTTIEHPEAPVATAEAPVQEQTVRKQGLLIYLLIGVFFGIVLTKSEVISWFRIQEMFRFQAFHLYGIIGSAVVVAALSVQIIKRFNVKTFGGEAIHIPPKEMGKGVRYWLGGILFGLGWALLGACPGPIFALIGNGITVIVVALLSALAGTWAYAYLRPKLPH
jgi:uncharacterized membrane protein YedE/YeeE